jgi:hypothetical protein
VRLVAAAVGGLGGAHVRRARQRPRAVAAFERAAERDDLRARARACVCVCVCVCV